MTTHIALLRAVNLGSHNKVAMADLRQLLADLGFTDVRTLLQSGNIAFEGGGKTSAQLEKSLQQAASKYLGLDTDFFVRTAKECRTVVAGNPFPDVAKRDPGKLVVVFLKDAPARAAVTALEQAIVGSERVQAKGRELYAVYPNGIGRSKLTMVLIEKKLGTTGTGRNWNTVSKLAALAEP